jgi:ATP-dependent helicase/DNAse subunit B
LFLVEPDPLDWGRLVHRFFERQFDSYLGRELLSIEFRPKSARTKDLPIRLQLFAEPLQHAVLRKLEAVMKAYLSAVRSGQCSSGQLLAQEIKIHRPIPGSESVIVSGQLDRIEDRGGEVHIVDYKSGQKPWSSRKEKELAAHLGYQLQPMLYPWLYQKQEGLSLSPRFSYIFLGSDPPQEIQMANPNNPEVLLNSLLEILEKGIFIPTSNEMLAQWGLKTARPCQYCDLNSLCRRFELETGSRSQNLFKDLATGRLEAMTQFAEEWAD